MISTVSSPISSVYSCDIVDRVKQRQSGNNGICHFLIKVTSCIAIVSRGLSLITPASTALVPAQNGAVARWPGLLSHDTFMPNHPSGFAGEGRHHTENVIGNRLAFKGHDRIKRDTEQKQVDVPEVSNKCIKEIRKVATLASYDAGRKAMLKQLYSSETNETLHRYMKLPKNTGGEEKCRFVVGRNWTIKSHDGNDIYTLNSGVYIAARQCQLVHLVKLNDNAKRYSVTNEVWLGEDREEDGNGCDTNRDISKDKIIYVG